MKPSDLHDWMSFELSDRERALFVRLSDLQKAAVIVLDDDFISASVIRERARLNAIARSVFTSRMPWSHTTPVVAAACHDLERYGLAEHRKPRGYPLWRRIRLPD